MKCVICDQEIAEPRAALRCEYTGYLIHPQCISGLTRWLLDNAAMTGEASKKSRDQQERVALEAATRTEAHQSSRNLVAISIRDWSLVITYALLKGDWPWR